MSPANPAHANFLVLDFDPRSGLSFFREGRQRFRAEWEGKYFAEKKGKSYPSGRMSTVFRSALRSFKAIFRLKASMSRAFLLLDFDHRLGIQLFRAWQHGFAAQRGQTSSNRKKQNLILSLLSYNKKLWQLLDN
jgi:hypothetical protein